MKSLALILIATPIIVASIVIHQDQNQTKAKPNNTAVADQAPEPLPQPDLEPTFSEPISDLVPPEVSFAQRAAEAFTTLTDKQDREIKAKVLSVVDDQVELRRDDGLETSIPLSMLSEADVAFCEYLREQSAQVAEIPTPVESTQQGTPEPNVLEAPGGIDWGELFGE